MAGYVIHLAVAESYIKKHEGAGVLCPSYQVNLSNT